MTHPTTSYSATGVRPVGPYHPVRQPYAHPAPAPTVGGAKDFFGDVWVGGKSQLKSYGQVVLHPVDSARRGWALLKNPAELARTIAAPYRHAIRSGNPGEAVGRLLANVAVVGAAVLGGRALLNRGGGASVGVRGPIASFFGGIGDALGGVTRGVSKALGRVGDALSSAFRWLLPTGGGGSVRFR